MLFFDFVKELGFDDAVAVAMRGNGEFPMVRNSAERILTELHSEFRQIFDDQELRSRPLEACGSVSRVPDDLSYYLVDDVSVQTTPDGEVDVHWFCHLGDDRLDIAVFRLRTKEFSLCGQSLSFVEGAKVASAMDTDMAEAVLAALELQKASGRDLFERWCFASDEWRRSHLICPVCGDRIYPYRADDRMFHAGCDRCGWESQKKYYYESEFADVETMKAERKRAKKEREREMAFKEQYQKLIEQINSYGLAAIHENPKNEVFHHYLDGLRKAQEMLKNTETTMLEKLKSKC